MAATSIFGLMQGGAQQAVRDASRPALRQRLADATGTIAQASQRGGVNPLAAARQVDETRIRERAAHANQLQSALAQARMDDAAGASQFFGNVLGAGASLAAMAIPGAQAAAPLVDPLTKMGTNALQSAVTSGMEQPGSRGALDGAQPTQNQASPLTAGEVPPNPYGAAPNAVAPNVGDVGPAGETLDALGGSPMGVAQGVLGNMAGAIPGAATFGANMQAGEAMDQASNAQASRLAGVIERNAASPGQAQEGRLSGVIARSAIPMDTPALGEPPMRRQPTQAQPGGAPRVMFGEAQMEPSPLTGANAIYDTMNPGAQIGGTRTQVPGLLYRGAFAGRPEPAPEAPPMYASPTLSGTSPEEVAQAQRNEFNARMAGAGPRVMFGEAQMEPPAIPEPPPMYPPPSIAAPPQEDPRVVAARNDFNERMAAGNDPRVLGVTSSVDRSNLQPPTAAPPMYPPPTIAAPGGRAIDSAVEVTRRDGIVLPEDRAAAAQREELARNDFNSRMARRQQLEAQQQADAEASYQAYLQNRAAGLPGVPRGNEIVNLTPEARAELGILDPNRQVTRAEVIPEMQARTQRYIDRVMRERAEMRDLTAAPPPRSNADQGPARGSAATRSRVVPPPPGGFRGVLRSAQDALGIDRDANRAAARRAIDTAMSFFQGF